MLGRNNLTNDRVLEGQFLQSSCDGVSARVSDSHYRGRVEHPVRCPARTLTVQVAQVEGQNG